MKMKSLITIFFAGLLVAGLNHNMLASGGDDRKTSEAEMTASLKGKVVDQSTGEELTGVKVEIKEMQKEAYTDFEGNYRFNELRPGKYDVAVSFISYKKREFSGIELENGKNNQITLKLESLE